ncbi:hypothetical protein Tco_0378905 [Tanacetum coccineum]
MQQFWHTAFKNEKKSKYYFLLDYQRFELGDELFRHVLQILPRQPNKQFFLPSVQEELVKFIKKLGVTVKGICKGNMEVNSPKSKKMKDPVPRRSRTITFSDNLLQDQDKALEYAKLVNMEETHNSFDKSAWNSTGDDKTESDRYSDNGAYSDKSDFERARTTTKRASTYSPIVTTTSADDVSWYLVDPTDVQMTELRNESLYTETTTMMVTPVLNIIHETQEENPAENERGDDVEEQRQEEELEHEVQSEVLGKHNLAVFQETTKELLVQSWFIELVDAEEEPEEHKLLNGLVVLFGKCMNKFLNKYNITKEDLEGPLFKLLKKIFKNSVELEYNIEQCHFALTDKIDLANPEGNRFHDDLSKPLPLVGPPEDDFPNLNQNDIEDLYMLKIQNKIHNVKGIEEFHLINALKLHIRIIVFRKRVEDVQLEVKSYQTKLNLTKPQLMEGCLQQKVSYTILSHPIGIMYKRTNNNKRFMRANEIHKFSDGTLNKVYKNLEVILRNNRLGYHNEGMEEYYWTKKDIERTQQFMENIERTLNERRRFRRLDFFFGGRRNKTEYRLLVRPKQHPLRG